MSNNDKLKYYMSLKYNIEISPIPIEDGGGFEAFIPQLGRLTMNGCGETPCEALQNLDEVKESLFSMWLKKGLDIPEPKECFEETYSGKILLRVSKEMHRDLVLSAKNQGISLNAYLNQTISLGHSLNCFKENLNNLLKTHSYALDHSSRC